MLEENNKSSNIGLLAMAKDVFNMVADSCSAEHGVEEAWNEWMEWINKALEFMPVEGGDREGIATLHNCTFDESRAVVLRLAEKLLELVLVKATAEERAYWLQIPLYYAVRNTNVDMTTRLLDNSSDLSQCVCGELNAPVDSALLHLAIRAVACADDPALNKNPAIVAALLERGANADHDTLSYDDTLHECGGGANQSPLRYASFFGLASVVQMLIEAGSTVDLLNAYGCSPLSQAIEQEQEEVARLLLSHGASPNAVDQIGEPVLCLASPEVAQDLLNAGFDVHAKDGVSRTLLSSACDLLVTDAVKKLLGLGTDDTIADDEGNSPADMVRAFFALKRARFPVNTTGTGTFWSSWSRRVRKWKVHDDSQFVAVAAILTSHRAWKRRGWLVVLRQRHGAGVAGGGVVGVAGWVVMCPDESLFRKIMEFV